MYQFVCICQRGTDWAYDEVLTTYKPYSTFIYDANDVSRKLAECLKTCLNRPKGRGEKRIGTLASEDGQDDPYIILPKSAGLATSMATLPLKLAFKSAEIKW